MARIRIVQQGSLFVPVCVPSADERDGVGFGSVDVTHKGGAVAESAHVLTTHTGKEICFSGPIRITEPGEKNKLLDTGKAAEASDAQEATDEVHSTNQEQSESLSRFPERLPSISRERRQKRATTQLSGSDSKRARDRNWTREETETLIACKSEPSLPKGKQGWVAIAAKIPTRKAKQCRERWDTLLKNEKNKLTTTTSSGPAANGLNGALTSTHLVGKPNLPSSACPNHEVSRPAVELEAPFLQQPVPEPPAVAQDGPPITTTAERSHPDAMTADHVHDYDDPIAAFLLDWDGDTTYGA